jgi:hypothetical protein
MPFLVPAVTAFICDTIIIWLNRLAPLAVLHILSNNENDKNNTNDNNNSTTRFSIYNVNYLAPLAGIRLVLLIIPLFHSYTGTAVRYVPIYQLLYSISLLTIIIHMTSLALLDPTSIESIFPGLLSIEHDHNNTTTNIDSYHRLLSSDSLHRLLELLAGENNNNTNTVLELRRIWWMLTLSAVAVSCHWILLYHVRSTAPISSSYFGNSINNRKPSVYFAVRTASSYASATQSSSVNFNNNNRLYHPTDGEPALIHAMNGTLKILTIFIYYLCFHFVFLIQFGLFFSHANILYILF